MASKTVPIAPNDKLSTGFGDLVPRQYRGTDKFLDVVCWNIRWFNAKEKKRLKAVTAVLDALNADIIVLEEVKDQSLKPVADALEKAKAGYYEVAYGTTGGDQRIALMYDFEWVRAKNNVHELFKDAPVTTSDGKNAFPRLPLAAYLTVVTNDSPTPFDFQLVGLHLKSQVGDGSPQRRLAAQSLADWMVTEAPKEDADVIMLGDWNEVPTAPAWQPFRDLEAQGKALFESINAANEVTHLMYKNKKEWGTRLDVVTVSQATVANVNRAPAVVRWKSLDALLASNPDAASIKGHLKWIRDNLSDHMPVVTRYYLTDK